MFFPSLTMRIPEHNLKESPTSGQVDIVSKIARNWKNLDLKMYTILLLKWANWHVARKYAKMGICLSSRPFLSALVICEYDFCHYFINIFSPKLKQFYCVPPETSASLASCFIRYLQYILKWWSSPCIKNYTTDTYYTYRETLSFNEITLNVCLSIYTEKGGQIV